MFLLVWSLIHTQGIGRQIAAKINFQDIFTGLYRLAV